MSPVVLAVKHILEQTMEQYLGQFLNNILTSIEGTSLSNTLFSGFMMLIAFTIVSYLVFRIALIALKVGTIVAVLSLVAGIGFPSGINPGSSNNSNPQNLAPNSQTQSTPSRGTNFSMPDLSQYLSEEALREQFLAFIKGLR